MCKRFIKPRSEVRRLGFCFLFHTDRGFNWVQISAPPSKAWQWRPFKPGPITAQRQSKSNNFTLIMTRCVCQYASSQGNSLTAFHWATMAAGIFRVFIYCSRHPSSPFNQRGVWFVGGISIVVFGIGMTGVSFHAWHIFILATKYVCNYCPGREFIESWHVVTLSRIWL